MSNQSASIRLSTERKGRKRRESVWVARYRIADRDSAKVLGKAWTKRSRSPEGYLTRSQAEGALRRVLAAEGAAARLAGGATFNEVADAYIKSLDARIPERQLPRIHAADLHQHHQQGASSPLGRPADRHHHVAGDR